MPIIIENKKIRHRSNEIRKLMLPLSRNGNSVSSKVGTSPRGFIVFGAFGGSNPQSTNHQDWFFKTQKTGFNASYFEAWKDNGSNFTLEKAYFKLMLNEDNVNHELLSLHIDPLENECRYKQGPHLHIKTNNDLISKAHISLNLSDMTEVVNSYDKFNNAYKNALLMINEEIITKPSW